MENKSTVNALNDLLQITNDRMEGFQKVEKKVMDFHPHLKEDFQEMATQSVKMKTELSSLIREKGGDPDNNTTVAGDLHRTWIDVKNALSADKDEASLENVTFGENAAITTYEDALKSGDLDPESTAVVRNQLMNLKSSYEKFKNLANLED
ncbi:ferritin-like domain-containing protein [Halpernia sp.]|uniref:ferritin-like domain-containing protein n=1 Tax=Halpernia sp. TaxID=2782209 RepID=UPI003A936DAB